jgi:hypothetical protein
LYQDQTAALTSDALALKGFTKILGRRRRINIADISKVTLRERSEFPNGQLPHWGLDDNGVWYTRDRRRYRRATAVEITIVNGDVVGFTPAHASRLRDLLVSLGVAST